MVCVAANLQAAGNRHLDMHVTLLEEEPASLFVALCHDATTLVKKQQKLDALYREAGFSKVEVFPCVVFGSAKDPAFFQQFIDEFAEIFESIDEALGPERVPTIQTWPSGS